MRVYAERQGIAMSERMAVVIGAGIIGLTTAIALSDDDWQVQVVAADPPERTTSAAAAGMWHPGAAANPVLDWARRSYAVYAAQPRRRHRA